LLQQRRRVSFARQFQRFAAMLNRLGKMSFLLQRVSEAFMNHGIVLIQLHRLLELRDSFVVTPREVVTEGEVITDTDRKRIELDRFLCLANGGIKLSFGQQIIRIEIVYLLKFGIELDGASCFALSCLSIAIVNHRDAREIVM